MLAFIRLPSYFLLLFTGLNTRPVPVDWLRGLMTTINSVVIGAVTTPWGAVGALLGGLIAWRQLPHRSAEVLDNDKAGQHDAYCGWETCNERPYPGELEPLSA